ncbi:alpha/beta fold hydrolase [Actinokineospora sp. UTMC 2448]|uniref:alpha/beta fold hydrolase n=1 Tax=Actinokineospora sp. UTMC 2448 TaxID=2268449 RepID=UPI0021643255|nr:hypothetical protein [Actinokineospora sp. UTMC 2448]UVS81039.1 hypothetical protein Actkin_04791 [Actinokineospora sp. UTMC 2448]
MWTDRRVRVSDGVELFVAGRPGHSPLLVIHGGPDWDHTYLRTPLHDLDRRVLLPDLRGRSTRGLRSTGWCPTCWPCSTPWRSLGRTSSASRPAA